MQAHIGECALNRIALAGVFFFVGVGHDAVDVEHHLGRGAPTDLRQDVFGLEFDHRIKLGVCVGVQGFPIGHGLVPFQAGRGEGAAFDIGDGFVVHRHQTRARTAFNGHIAHRHAAFHAECANGRASKLNGVAGAARRANFSDDGQHHIFAGHAFGQRAFNQDAHVFGFFGQQGLRGQHMLHLRGANAVSQRAKRAVG